MNITIASTEYEVVHSFSESRVLISYEGLTVFADQVEGVWEFSSESIREDERSVVATFLSTFQAPGRYDVPVQCEVHGLPSEGLLEHLRASYSGGIKACRQCVVRSMTTG